MNVYQDDGEDDDGAYEETDLGNDQDFDDEPTVPCPYCRLEILEDSPRCPYCERYISAEDHTGPRKPLWVIATALVCLGDRGELVRPHGDREAIQASPDELTAIDIHSL